MSLMRWRRLRLGTYGTGIVGTILLIAAGVGVMVRLIGLEHDRRAWVEHTYEVIDRLRVASAALAESEARYRLLAETSSDMIFRLDLDGVRRYASPACRDILGDEPEQLVGRRPAEQIHPDDRQEVTATFDALPAGRVDRAVLVNRLGRRDGSWSWVEAKLRLVRDRQGGPLEIVGSLSDISARRAAEQRWPRTRRTTV